VGSRDPHRLVDFDDHEPSNTNRQIACFVDTLGHDKAEVLRAWGMCSLIGPEGPLVEVLFGSSRPESGSSP